MAELRTVARPYARAVFSQARQENRLAEWQQILEALSLVVQGCQSLHVIGNPKVSDVQLLAICTSVISSVVTSVDEAVFKSFVQLLIEEKRLPAVPAMALLFHQLVAAHNQVVEVQVESAAALTEEQKQTLVKALEARFKQHVEVTYQENPDLIGGFMAKSGNWVFDGSIKSKLERLAETIK